MPISVHSYWASDPILAAEEMNGAAGRLMNFAEPLAAAREVVVRDIREHFEKQEDPNHHPWAEWSVSYRDRASRENVAILQKRVGWHSSNRSGQRLIDASTSRRSYHVSGHELFADTAAWPDYWEVHQQGASHSPFNRETKTALEELGVDVVATETPARPFLGISEEAEFAIYDILDEFVDGAMLFTHPITGATQRRGPGGQFAKGF